MLILLQIFSILIRLSLLADLGGLILGGLKS
jgi:hypothetical protein